MDRLLLYLLAFIVLLLALGYRATRQSSGDERVGPSFGLIGNSLNTSRPIDSKAALALCQGELLLGNGKKARQWLSQSKDSNAVDFVHLEAHSFLIEGKEQEAKAVVDKALKEFPKAEQLHALEIYFLKREPRALLDYLAVLDQRAKDVPALYLRLSSRLEGQRQWSAQCDVLRRARALFSAKKIFKEHLERIERYLKKRAPKIEKVALGDIEVNATPARAASSSRTTSATIVGRPMTSKPRYPHTFPRASYRGSKDKRVSDDVLERLIKDGYVGMALPQLKTLFGEPTKRLSSSHPSTGLFAHIPRPERWDYIGRDGKNGVVVQIINGKVTAIGPYRRRTK